MNMENEITLSHISDDVLNLILEFLCGSDMSKSHEMIRNGTLVSKKFASYIYGFLQEKPVKCNLKKPLHTFHEGPSMLRWMAKHKIRIASFAAVIKFRREMLYFHVLEHCDLSTLTNLDIEICCGGRRKMYPRGEEEFDQEFITLVEDMNCERVYPYLTDILTRNKTKLRHLTIRGYPAQSYGEESLLELAIPTLESLEFALLLKEARDPPRFFDMFERMPRLKALKIAGYQNIPFRIHSKTVVALNFSCQKGQVQIGDVQCPSLRELTIGKQPDSATVEDIAKNHPQLERLNFEMVNYRGEVTTEVFESACKSLSKAVSRLANLRHLRVNLNLKLEGEFNPSLKIDSKSLKVITLVTGIYTVKEISCPALQLIEFRGPYKESGNDDSDEDMADEGENGNRTKELIKVAMTPVNPPIPGETGPFVFATDSTVGEMEFVGMNVPNTCALTVKLDK